MVCAATSMSSPHRSPPAVVGGGQVAQQLVDRGRDRFRGFGVVQQRQLIRVLEQGRRAERARVRGGLVAGDEQQHACPRYFLSGQFAVFDAFGQLGQQVITGGSFSSTRGVKQSPSSPGAADRCSGVELRLMTT
ncbi:hypothetical protein GU90_01440 [Saccharopolyspora rectivirgula]|jgi:hypothetical protein|uniref:Uncharacterized protein n=2 Tax=Saccharopolyspora rectivirgula TaxID=28042 RepID=A0A073B2U9_9PSEU|nr:hypothetical protein GU90_01440 [Saccharopolyspora rectivirgula]